MLPWPLVGRTAELAIAQEALARRTGIILYGPAGVGKTRLGLACLSQATKSGYAEVRVVATHATSDLPFGAFASVLPQIEAGLGRGQVLQHCAHELAKRNDGAPKALFIDDAHLLDESSAALVRQLVATSNTLVIATVREGEPVHEPITRLWADELAVRVDVPPLTESKTGQLLAEVLGAAVEGVTVRALFQASLGNILFLRELVLEATNSGDLRMERGLWRLEADPPISRRLHEIVGLNLRQLSKEEWNALEFLAVGEPLEAEMLREVLKDEVNLAELEAKGLARSTNAGARSEVSLGHPVYGEVIRNGIPAWRTREIAQRLAGWFAKSDIRPEDVLRVGAWRLHGGDLVDPDGMLQAAQRAVALHDFRLAAELAKASVEAGGGFDGSLLLAQLESWRGDHEEAEARFAALSTEELNDRDLANLTMSRIDNLSYGLGRWEEAVSVANAAEMSMTTPAHVLELAGYRASLLDIVNDASPSLDSRTVTAIEKGEGRALAWACMMGGWNAGRRGRLAEALTLTERGRAAHGAIKWPPLPWGVETGMVIRAWALTFAGHFDDAQAIAEDVYSRALFNGDLEAVSIAAANLCATHVGRGQMESAWRWGTESVNTARRGHRRTATLKHALIPLAEALAVGGRGAEAGQALNEIADLVPIPMFESERARVEAWVRVCRDGDTDSAVPLLRKAVSIASGGANWVWESAALHDLARLGHASDVAPRLGELALIVEGPLIRARAQHAAALAANDGQALADTSAEFESFGALLLAAEAAADCATAWSKINTRQAAAAVHRLSVLRQRCPQARTPALSTSIRVRAELAPRQLEIARLAAAGATNRQIANRLQISVRTVENSLYEVFKVLGISARNQLAAEID